MNLEHDYGNQEDLDAYNELLKKYHDLLRSNRDSAKDSIDYQKEYLILLDKYNELIYAVETKFEGESRHQTALRYIKERENQTPLPQQVITKTEPWIDPSISPKNEWNITPIVVEQK